MKENTLNIPIHQSKDYYDYLLVNVGIICEKTFLLVNVTVDNLNRGNILAVFHSRDHNEGIESRLLKEYFEGNENIFVLEEKDNL